MFGLEEDLQDKVHSTKRKLEKAKSKIDELRKDLKFALINIDWDSLSSKDLEEVKRLCIKAKLMDKDGNWFR